MRPKGSNFGFAIRLIQSAAGARKAKRIRHGRQIAQYRERPLAAVTDDARALIARFDAAGTGAAHSQPPSSASAHAMTKGIPMSDRAANQRHRQLGALADMVPADPTAEPIYVSLEGRAELCEIARAQYGLEEARAPAAATSLAPDHLRSKRSATHRPR